MFNISFEQNVIMYVNISDNEIKTSNRILNTVTNILNTMNFFFYSHSEFSTSTHGTIFRENKTNCNTLTEQTVTSIFILKWHNFDTISSPPNTTDTKNRAADKKKSAKK